MEHAGHVDVRIDFLRQQAKGIEVPDRVLGQACEIGETGACCDVAGLYRVGFTEIEKAIADLRGLLMRAGTAVRPGALDVASREMRGELHLGVGDRLQQREQTIHVTDG